MCDLDQRQNVAHASPMSSISVSSHVYLSMPSRDLGEATFMTHVDGRFDVIDEIAEALDH